MSSLRLIIVVGLAAALPSCQGLDVVVGAAYLQSEARGTTSLGPTGTTVPISALQLSLAGDLDVDDDSPSLYGFVDAKIDRLRVHASAFRFEARGNSVLPRGYGDLIPGTPVGTDLDFTNGRLAVTYDIVDLDYFWLSVGAAADYIDWDIDVVAQNMAASEALRSEVVVPMPYVRFGLIEGDVAAQAAVGAMAADLGDGDGTWVDLEAMVSYRPASAFELFGGYRWIRVDGDGIVTNQAYDADLEVSGWFLGGALHFGFQRPKAGLFD